MNCSQPPIPCADSAHTFTLGLGPQGYIRWRHLVLVCACMSVVCILTLLCVSMQDSTLAVEEKVRIQKNITKIFEVHILLI